VSKPKRTIVLIGTAVLISWSLFAINGVRLARWTTGDATLTSAGTWGDSFGGFNAIVSALGFAAVIATLVLQEKSLNAQQADQHKQGFERTFFELLRLTRELRDEVRFRYSTDYLKSRQSKRVINTATIHGPDAITTALNEMRFWLRRGGSNASTDRKQVVSLYERYVQTRFESRLGPYFRMIYTILRRIRDDEILTEDEKTLYANILRSQLSSHELSLTALNSLSPVANDLMELLTHFHMLKYLPNGRLRTYLEVVFPEAAFAARD